MIVNKSNQLVKDFIDIINEAMNEYCTKEDKTRANISGAMFEYAIERVLSFYGYTENINDSRHFVRQPKIGKNRQTCDIHIVNKATDLDIWVESKWQNSSGTAKEKLNFTLDKYQYGVPLKNVYLVVDGKEIKDKDIDYLLDCRDYVFRKDKNNNEMKKNNVIIGRLDDFIGYLLNNGI
jgi:hypothetical protein